MNALSPEAFVGLAKLDVISPVEPSEGRDGDDDTPLLSDLLAPLSNRVRAPPSHVGVAEEEHLHIGAADDIGSD